MSKLITYAYLKQETDISTHVDNAKLDNPIKNAQDRLRALICPAFYDQLVSQNATTPKTLSTDNEAFYTPYVIQYLAWGTSITTPSGLYSNLTGRSRTVTGADSIVQADDGRTIYFNSASPFNFTRPASPTAW